MPPYALNMVPFYGSTSDISNEPLIQDDYVMFSVDPFSNKIISMDPVIDPSLKADADDGQVQDDWPLNLQSSPSHNSYDAHGFNTSMIPRVSACPSNIYGACEPSISYRSSPGYSSTASPSIGSEACMPPGPATPPSSRLPLFAPYDASGLDYAQPMSHLEHPEAFHRQAMAISRASATPSSPYPDAASVGNLYCSSNSSLSLDVPTYLGESCSGSGTYPRSESGYEDEYSSSASGPFGIQFSLTPAGGRKPAGTKQHDHVLAKRAQGRAGSPRSKRPTATHSFTSAGSLAPSGIKKARPSSHLAATSTPDQKYCQKCKVNFKTCRQLEEHVKAKHARPFICVFHFAGCSARFEAKNEWKRHVLTKHVSLRYWLCLEGGCASSRGSTTHKRSSTLPQLGSIFNRKDLYTQHVRRMHPDAGHHGGDERLRRMQEGALRKRLETPHLMTCPVGECRVELAGPGAWNEWMEHIAQKHFDCAAPGYKADLGFGGPESEQLTTWAHGNDIIKRTAWGWRLCEPLKGENDCKRRHPETPESGDSI